MQERLEIAKAAEYIDGLGKINVDDYFERIEDEDIIGSKEDDVIDNGDGTYDVTTKPGYIFVITLLPDQDNPNDIDIEYKDKITEPRITSIEVLDKTTNSISVSIESINSNGITYIYSYKKNSEDDSQWVQAGKTSEKSYVISGLEANELYNIKVEMENNEEQRTINVLTSAGDGAIVFGDIEWNNGKASVTISTNTEYIIQYQKNNTGDWIEIENNGTLSGLENNDIINVRLTDGTNIGDYASLNIIDNVLPEDAVITLSGEGTVTQNPTVTARIKQVDNQTGVNITGSKWILNTSSELLGENPDNYTGGSFSSEEEEINLPLSDAGTYYLHILTVDNAGKAKETISQAINMTVNIHNHTGSSTSGGGCYTIPVYHTHGSSCYATCTVTKSGCITGIDKNDNYITCSATITHSSCGQGTIGSSHTHLDDGNSHVMSSSTSTHSYLKCSISTSTAQSYNLGCGMEENQILSYTISY